jgi:hypothetical protein
MIIINLVATWVSVQYHASAAFHQEDCPQYSWDRMLGGSESQSEED